MGGKIEDIRGEFEDRVGVQMRDLPVVDPDGKDDPYLTKEITRAKREMRKQGVRDRARQRGAAKTAVYEQN